jgi:hypothetical protein
MTYSSGQQIASSDYNGFVTSVNTVLSAYGQTLLSSVTGGTSVVAGSGQWQALGANINLLATHQGTTVSSYSSQFGSGTVVSAIGTVSGDVTSISAGANIYNSAASGTTYSTISGAPTKTAATGSGQTAWNITFTSTIAFGSASNANAFFNAGGIVRIQFGKTSTGTFADTEWNTFVGAGGAGSTRMPSLITLTAVSASKRINSTTYAGTNATGGAGTVTNLGWADLNGSAQTIYQVNDTGSAYSSNYVRVQATNNGSGSLVITTIWHSNGDSNPGTSANISGGAAATAGPTYPGGLGPTTFVWYTPPPATGLTTQPWVTTVPTITNSVA